MLNVIRQVSMTIDREDPAAGVEGGLIRTLLTIAATGSTQIAGAETAASAETA